MARRFGPPSGKWRAFLCNHAGEILACDFFTVRTASFKALIGFVVIELSRRRIVPCDVTSHPTATWAASIIQRAWLACRGQARYLLRDRDSIYGDEFKRAVRKLGLRQVVTQYHSPLENAHAERVIGTIRRECLDHMIVLGEAHARRVLGEYARDCNAERAQKSLDGDAPEHRARRLGVGRAVAVPHFGGLHDSYRRAAWRPAAVARSSMAT